MGKLRFGVAFAVRARNWIPAFAGMTIKEGFPGGGRKRKRGNLEVAKVNYPVQGTPGSLINL